MTQDDGTLLHTLVGHSGQVHSVAFSHDGTKIASGSDDKTIKIWDMLCNWELVHTLSGCSDYVRTVAYNSDSTRLASGSWDKSIKIWDIPPALITSRDNSWMYHSAFSIVVLGSIWVNYGQELGSIWKKYRPYAHEYLPSNNVMNNSTIELQPIKECSIETPFIE